MKKKLNNIEEYIGGSIFIFMLVILAIQILARQFFNLPLRWSEELSRFLFVYIGYFGVSASIKENSHVYIDFFVKKFPKRVQHAINIFVQFAILIILVIMFYVGVQMTIRKIPVKIVSLNLSYAYMYIALPLTSVLMIFRQIQRNYLEYQVYKKGGQ